MRRRATGARQPAFPREWKDISRLDGTDDYEYVPLRLPPDVTRVTASMRLSIEAEFGGWEISRVRLYTDGSRKVLLRRRRPRSADTPAANTAPTAVEADR